MANRYAEEYLKGLFQNPEKGEQLRKSYLRYRELCEENLDNATNLIYSYNLTPVGAILLFDLGSLQKINGGYPNVSKLFINLKTSEKNNPEKLLQNYNRAIANLPKKDFAVENNKQTIGNQIKEVHEKRMKENEEKRVMRPLSASNDKVMNPVMMPKTTWVLNVYAKSFEDYCHIVEDTLKTLKKMNFTVILKMPEDFRENIQYTSSCIAYSVLINDNFSFTKLDDDIINAWDEEADVPKTGVRISGRTNAEFKKITADCFTDFNGNLCKKNLFMTEKYQTVEKCIEMFEHLGQAENVVRYHQEIMTGVLAKDSEQFYKTIVVKTKDLDNILQIVKRYDKYNLDFTMDTNEKESKIIFIHLSHLIDVINDIYDTDYEIQENPSFDAISMDDFEDE